MMWMLLACAGDPAKEPGADSADSDPSLDSSADSGGDTAADSPVEACDDLAPLPLVSASMRGFTQSEDFAFDGEGNVASVDLSGNLVLIDIDLNTRVWLPGFGEASGMRFLPGGDLVIGAPSEGALYRVAPSGASWVLVSGLSYPNGVDVDLDGYVYVSEQSAGQVRRVDPESGDWTVVASGLYNPNGITFTPDFQTMLVGSFGDGTVTAVSREGDGWGAPRIYAMTPDAPILDRGHTCDGLVDGDTCYLDYGGVGACDASLACVDATDFVACEGVGEGDACATTLLGTPLASTCTLDGEGALYCPRADAERVALCDGVVEGDTCELARGSGYCLTSWEGVRECVSFNEYTDGLYGDCGTLNEGDPCLSGSAVGPYAGTCTDYSANGWGTALYCAPPGGFGERGGLDGVNMDACGNLYVTEYIKGMVWRFAAEGAAPEEVSSLSSSWIPNLHWGLGLGGFGEETVYVADRDRGRLFPLEVGVTEKQRAYAPVSR